MWLTQKVSATGDTEYKQCSLVKKQDRLDMCWISTAECWCWREGACYTRAQLATNTTSRGLLSKLDFNLDSRCHQQDGFKIKCSHEITSSTLHYAAIHENPCISRHPQCIGGGEICTFQQLASAKLEVFSLWVNMSKEHGQWVLKLGLKAITFTLKCEVVSWLFRGGLSWSKRRVEWSNQLEIWRRHLSPLTGHSTCWRLFLFFVRGT